MKPRWLLRILIACYTCFVFLCMHGGCKSHVFHLKSAEYSTPSSVKFPAPYMTRVPENPFFSLLENASAIVTNGTRTNHHRIRHHNHRGFSGAQRRTRNIRKGENMNHVIDLEFASKYISDASDRLKVDHSDDIKRHKYSVNQGNIVSEDSFLSYSHMTTTERAFDLIDGIRVNKSSFHPPVRKSYINGERKDTNVSFRSNPYTNSRQTSSDFHHGGSQQNYETPNMEDWVPFGDSARTTRSLANTSYNQFYTVFDNRFVLVSGASSYVITLSANGTVSTSPSMYPPGDLLTSVLS